MPFFILFRIVTRKCKFTTKHAASREMTNFWRGTYRGEKSVEGGDVGKGGKIRWRDLWAFLASSSSDNDNTHFFLALLLPLRKGEIVVVILGPTELFSAVRPHGSSTS